MKTKLITLMLMIVSTLVIATATHITANHGAIARQWIGEHVSENPGPEYFKLNCHDSNNLPCLMDGMATKDTLAEQAYVMAWPMLPRTFQVGLPKVVRSEMIRANAAATVGFLGTNARAAVPALIQLLHDDVASGNAAISLGMIGSDASAAVPDLIVILKEQRPFAATALGKIGAEARSALPALSFAQNGPDWLRRESCWAIRQIQHDIARHSI
jgi:HEAT repeat protein